MRATTWSWPLMVLAGVLAAPAAAHDDEVLFNRVYLETRAEASVANDEMEVSLIAQHEASEPTAAAGKVNDDMAWALELARRYDDVETGTRGYQTYPVYERRTIVGWRGSQELTLTGESIPRLTELVGKLQERLQVRNMNFRPTRAVRDTQADELINEAVAAFKQRAEIVGRHMDSRNYRIVELHVNTGESSPPVAYAQRAAMQAMEMDSQPAVEAGTSKVVVTVSGSVQFY